MIKTYGRLRTKFGATIEDVELPDIFDCAEGIGNWRFIGQFKGLPKHIINRFSMIYLPEGGLKC